MEISSKNAVLTKILQTEQRTPSLNSRFEIAEDLSLFFRIVRYDARIGAPGIIRPAI